MNIFDTFAYGIGDFNAGFLAEDQDLVRDVPAQ